MCGICGKINLDGRPVDEDLVRRMAATLSHRGPDDAGVYAKGGAGLGHRRLSIIDLSPSGHQPMCNEDGTVWIVFNGEVYNYQALRSQLLAQGHRFKSNSDTETIIHGYEEWGIEGILKHLRGMFAFAIWDERDRTLFLARDRVGKKPLVYYLDKDCLIFGSEIKAILADDGVTRVPDFTAIHHYLTWQSVPSPFSAFSGIRKLPPAHYLVCKGGKTELSRYWGLSYLPKHDLTVNGLKAEIVSRLTEAIRIRLISDVPLGAFLSGGIDSSAVVALMAGIMKEPVKTFSIGFKEESYNELKYARMVAERYGTDHTEFIVEPDAVEVLPKLVWHYNEPFADPSAIPTYYVSKLARQHVTVVLNGDGGDENFAGYGRYRANAFSQAVHRFFPTPLAKVMLPMAMLLPHGKGPDNFFWKVKRFLQEYVKCPELRNAGWLCHFSPEKKEEIYTPEFAAQVCGSDSFELILDRYREAQAASFIDKTLYADVMMYLPDCLLVKVDIASMANSLEARSPFLDHELMEFAARIPADLKLKGRTTKYILKEALRGMLPDDVLFRPKMGFGVPLDCWFRNELREMAYDTLLGRRAVERGYFNRDYVKRLLDEHVSGKWNWQYHIYDLLMLELWHNTFIDTNP